MAICANDKGVLVGRMTRLFLAEDAVTQFRMQKTGNI